MLLDEVAKMMHRLRPNAGIIISSDEAKNK